MDRCHRIGQTKPVHVYRLATAQSVEVSLSASYNPMLHNRDMLAYTCNEVICNFCDIRVGF